MRILCFQARRFHWKTHSKTLDDVPDQNVDETVEAALVAFIHAEVGDAAAERTLSVQRQTLKHIKWLANKRSLTTIVLHSFAHLGGETAPSNFAENLIKTLAQRLSENGYQVRITPFGYFCEWDLSVYGDSLAKVWKEIR
jgi:hypothetical protein